MMVFLSFLLSLFASADINCQRTPCHKSCLPPGFVCVPFGSEVFVKPYIPLVEGQSVVYLNSQKFPYDQIEAQMTPFFRDWAKSCPEEKRHGSSRGRPNLISVQRYSQIDQQSKEDLSRTISQVRPNTIIVQLSGAVQKFSKKYWNDFLDRIPVSRGCFILTPVTVTQYSGFKGILKSIEELILQKKHSCQILHVNEEVRGTVSSCAGPMKRSEEQLDRCQIDHWVKQVQLKACDLDPRTYVRDPEDGISQPAGAAAGN